MVKSKKISLGRQLQLKGKNAENFVYELAQKGVFHRLVLSKSKTS